jgi:hypothetical protein
VGFLCAVCHPRNSVAATNFASLGARETPEKQIIQQFLYKKLESTLEFFRSITEGQALIRAADGAAIGMGADRKQKFYSKRS